MKDERLLRYNKSRYGLFDELNFIKALANPYRSFGKSGEQLLNSLCDDYRLDPEKCLKGYLKSMHLRKNWGGIDPDMIYMLREEAEKQLILWRNRNVDIDKKVG
tara:strand:- start:569 stop:880 length:312 start_codon:yes stop_codon:yes gene_type:complete